MDKIKAPLIVEEVTDAGWQRKIRGTCEAISPTYPVGNISLSKELYDGPITKGKQYFCVFEDTGLKDSGKDADKTWNYWWKVAEWDVEDSGDDIPWGAEPSAPAKSTPSSPVFDATAGQRYTQLGLNVRTALMQAVDILTVKGEYLGTDKGLEEVADSLLAYMNSRIFTDSPLAVNALEAGAVPVSVEKKPDVNEALYTGTVTEIKSSEWFRPAEIVNGKEFKTAATTNGFELDWVMQKFQEIGIRKSADFVNDERGSYLDLLNLLIDTAEKENVAKGLQDLEEI